MKKRSGGRKIRPIEERFWEKVRKTRSCWIWEGSRQKSGHGQIGIGGIGGKYAGNTRAHRLSWILHNGEIKDPNLCVCHKCDKPWCVNPNHLFLGTQKENLEDMTKKGRRKWGNGIGKNNNNFGKHWDNKFKNKMRKLYSKTYILTKENGRKIKITNLRKFCSDNGYNQGGFSQLRNKKIERYYEFIAIEPA